MSPNVRIVGLLVGALLLAACQDASPTPSPSWGTPSHESTSTSPTASPSPTKVELVPGQRTKPLLTKILNPAAATEPPVYPQLAAQHNPIGASETVDFYVASVNWLYAASDPSILDAISVGTCEACQRLIARVRYSQSRGHYAGGRLTNTGRKFREQGLQHGAEIAIETTVRQQPFNFVDRTAGPTPIVAQATDNITTVYLVWHTDRWLVAEVETS